MRAPAPTRARTFVATLALALTASLAPSVASAGAPDVELYLAMGACAIDGTAEGINLDELTIKHRGADGKLKATHVADVSGGIIETGCPGPVIRPGDKLALIEGGETTPFRTFTVPTMRLTQDRVNDTLSGKVTGGVSEVGVRVSLCDAGLVGCTGTPQFQAPVGGTGAFSVDAGEDLSGTTIVDLEWRKGGDSVSYIQRTGRLLIIPGSATITGAGSKAGQSVTVTVKRGTKIGSATTTTSANASLRARIKRDGAAMPLKAGDKVSATFSSDAKLTVPVTSLAYDGSKFADGRCFANGDLRLAVYDDTGLWQGFGSATAAADGTWSSEVGAVAAGWRIDAWCANAKGDAIRLRLVVS